MRQDLEILNDSSFMVCARPSGQRYLVTSGKGETISRNSLGFFHCDFQSSLPNGSLNMNKSAYGIQHSKNNCSVLDCIFVE